MSTFPILAFFNYDHLPEGMIRDTSKRFYELAYSMLETLDKVGVNHQELAAGLRKLLEAKDCFVRTAISLR